MDSPSQELHRAEGACDNAGAGFNLRLETLWAAQTLKEGRHCHQLLGPMSVLHLTIGYLGTSHGDALQEETD